MFTLRYSLHDIMIVLMFRLYPATAGQYSLRSMVWTLNERLYLWHLSLPTRDLRKLLKLRMEMYRHSLVIAMFGKNLLEFTSSKLVMLFISTLTAYMGRTLSILKMIQLSIQVILQHDVSFTLCIF
jgi:hypothetical protein